MSKAKEVGVDASIVAVFSGMLGIFTNVRMPLHTESRFRGKAVDSPMIPNSVIHTAGNHCATVSPTKNMPSKVGEKMARLCHASDSTSVAY